MFLRCSSLFSLCLLDFRARARGRAGCGSEAWTGRGRRRPTQTMERGERQSALWSLWPVTGVTECPLIFERSPRLSATGYRALASPQATIRGRVSRRRRSDASWRKAAPERAPSAGVGRGKLKRFIYLPVPPAVVRGGRSSMHALARGKSSSSAFVLSDKDPSKPSSSNCFQAPTMSVATNSRSSRLKGSSTATGTSCSGGYYCAAPPLSPSRRPPPPASACTCSSAAGQPRDELRPRERDGAAGRQTTHFSAGARHASPRSVRPGRAALAGSHLCGRPG